MQNDNSAYNLNQFEIEKRPQHDHLSHEKVHEFASSHTGHINITKFPIDPKAIKVVPAKVVLHYKFMPLELRGNVLKVAVNSLNNITLFDDLRIFLGYEIVPFLAREEDIVALINKYYGIGADTIEGLIEHVFDDDNSEDNYSQPEVNEITENEEDEASIITFVNRLFYDAFESRATDIHIEPFEDALRIRFRIDGELVALKMPQDILRLKSSLIARIKIMAGVDIAERRLPQDGRIKVKINDRALDMRVSTLPTPYGESMNIRLLSSQIEKSLDALGFHVREINTLEGLIGKSHGIVLVTGPTGSGKTSTLYTALNMRNKDNCKIITIEDPVEYNLQGITQMQVKPKIGFTFASGLRSILRHDPDIIMIGEIRDRETAEIAFRSALTGHLVFSTLHTNSATQTITRLMDIGLEPYLIADSLECIISQRLVRVICPECKINVQYSDEERERYASLLPGFDVPYTGYVGIGCPHCNHTGYAGRTVIAEVLVTNKHVKQMIHDRAPASKIYETALSNGMQDIFSSGLHKVRQGITTLEELAKATNL